MSENPILDIADLSTLQYTTALDCVSSFYNTWGIKPKAVSIPILSSSGIPFENPLTTAVEIKYKNKNDPVYLGFVINAFSSLGLDVYLTLVPTLEFVKADALHLIDIKGDSSQQACFSKSSTIRFLEQIIELSIGIASEACADAAQKNAQEKNGITAGKTVGIAIDLTDVLPMGASKERLQLTCFCPECRSQLTGASKTGTDLIRAFETFPNPWNLALKDNGTGIGYISDIDWNISVDTLLGLSKLRGFDEHYKDGYDTNGAAKILIDYLHARHKQIIKSCSRLFTKARSSIDQGNPEQFRRILITEGTPYNWTAGVFTKMLDSKDVCDELWYDPTGKGLVTENISFRSYMWRRSRYIQNAFFALVEHAQDEGRRASTGLARLPTTLVRKEVDRRRTMSLAGRLEDKIGRAHV